MTGLGFNDPFTTFVGSAFFWFFAVMSVVAAYLMVFHVRNLVRAALALTVTLGGVAAMYGVMGADFLTVVQLVVYVGAIMVLMIFAIFLTPGQIDTPGIVGPGQRIGAFVVSLLVLFVSLVVVVQNPWDMRTAPLDVPTAPALGGLMLTQYVLPFEIASVLLTVALVGAIVIARED